MASVNIFLIYLSLFELATCGLVVTKLNWGIFFIYTKFLTVSPGMFNYKWLKITQYQCLYYSYPF